MNRNFILVGIAAATAAGVALLQAQPPAGERPKGPPPGMQFPDLIGAIKTSPGCLGVETARTGSGKNVIFAWFKDKAAVVEWYNSRTHQGVARQFFGPAEPDFKPLAGVPDDSGPLMVVASITFSDKPAFEDTQLSISQIAIEIYQPVIGGLFLGSRFAPEGVQVKGIRDYTPGAR